MRSFARIVVLVLVPALSFAASKKVSLPKKTAAPLTQQQRAIHALNRLTFGPRPGDLDQVLKIGVDKWIDQQLHPDSIDDSALNARLAPLRTLNMCPKELVQKFPSPGMIRAVADGKAQPPNDPMLAMIYRA